MDPVPAAFLALAAGAVFAVSAVLQHQAARSLGPPGHLSFSMFWALVRRPVWLGGTASLLGAYAVAALALDLGNVSLVAPLVVTELVFAVPLAARREHRQPGRLAWTGTVLVVGGVATFLLAASPSGGHPDPGTGSWVLMVLPCAVVAGGAVVLAGRRPRRRASLLAVAAGVSFGLLSVFTKNLTYLIGSDGLGFAAHWQPYALAGLGAGGFLFSQSAYQAGPLGSSLPVIDALEPTVAVVLAAAGFGEHLGHSGLAIVLEALGAAAAIAGVSLVGRSPLVVDLYGAPAPAGCPAGGPGAGGALG